jgi:hypothetical protein
MLLPDEFIERARSHAVSQRARALGGGIVVRDGREKIHEFTRSFHHRRDLVIL